MEKIQKKIYYKSPHIVKNVLASIIGFKNHKKRYGKHFSEYYNFLNNSKDFTLSQLKEYQFKELIKLIKHCYNKVPFYNQLFDNLNISINNISSIDDIEKIPIIDKDTILKNKDEFISRNYNKKKLIPMHTSGTSGSGLQFYVSLKAWQKEYAFVWARRRNGVQKGEKRLTFNGRSIIPFEKEKPPFWINNYYSNQILFSQYHMTEKNLKYYTEKINKTNYKYIEGYPSTIYIIADYILENNITLNNYPKKIFTSSETLFEWQRDVIEKAFKSRIFDSYGTSELTTLITECEYGNYHLNYEYGITELKKISREDNEVKYELISTGFLNKAFPLLRYKIGDYILIDESIKSCKCGAPGPVIQRIEGRMEDIIVTPSGRKIGRLDHIFKDMEKIKESQIVQETRDEISIKVVKRKGYSLKDEKKLLNEFKERLGEEIEYNIEYVKNINRTSSGKFKAVISKVKGE